MKFQASIAAIITGSLIIFGLIYVAVDNISRPQSPEARKPADRTNSSRPEHSNNAMIKSTNNNIINSVDQEAIKAAVALSEHDLKQEFETLSIKLKTENLFARLENKLLEGEQKQQAKALIERFTLLALESTRRRYVPIEPELKDPLYAHRDSLKDIRKLVDKY
jgi:uncharacterized UBP type Zn finger protein